MSITSSATTSRDHDVPSAKVIFRDRLCLVSITRRDDTLMDASSISEEDIIEICVTKGHTHPLDVLCYSVMESVVLFHSPDELQCATCGIIKMMEFQGEAITVRAMAPLEAHVTAYIATSHTNPSNRERELHTPPQQTLPSRGTPGSSPSRTWGPCQPWAASAHGGPNMGNCTMWNTCAPLQSPPNEWVCPTGSKEPDEHDQEVTFPGGGRWESIMRSLKGTVADMAWYMGPTADVSNILKNFQSFLELWHHLMS